jgi:putative endonuclease
MYYFYVLKFRKSDKLYKGLTNDLRRRVAEHRRGQSSFTRRNGEFDLIFYEAYINKKDAQEAEKYFKTGHGREVLKEKIKNTLGGVA